MNREIKFRAWNPDNPNLSQRMVDNPLQRCDANDVLEKKGIYKNWILMQFTGLLDKNGKEIYEGDILSAPSHSFAVEWDKAGYWNCMRVPDMEVIGNIYENENLLTKAEI